MMSNATQPKERTGSGAAAKATGRLVDIVPGLSRHAHASIAFYARGQFERRSFLELQRDVGATARKLAARGFVAGMHVGFLAENGYEWLVHDLALLQLDCCVTALTPAVLKGGVEEVVDTFGIEVVLTVGQSSERELGGMAAAWIARSDSVSGVERRARAPSSYAPPNHEHAFRIFSSGSTGRYRCLAVSRTGLEAAIDNTATDFPVTPDDTLLLFLPVANLQQKSLAYAALQHGVSLAITDPLRLFPMLKQGRPTLLLAPPLFYETIVRSLCTGRTGRVVEGLFKLSRSVVLGGVARWGLRRAGRAVRARLGGRTRMMLTGMAPISRETIARFSALGLPLYEAYGTTETGTIACNRPSATRRGSVGRVASGVSLQLAADGEVLAARCPPLTVGYVDAPQDMAGTYLADGWVATGDVGSLDSDGYLILRGRKKNVLVMSDGQKFHPEVLEKEISASPLVRHCAVLAGDGAGLICVINADDDRQATQAVLREYVADCLAQLGHTDSLESVVFFAEPFSTENCMLTPNLKLNRDAIRARVRGEPVSSVSAGAQVELFGALARSRRTMT